MGLFEELGMQVDDCLKVLLIHEFEYDLRVRWHTHGHQLQGYGECKQERQSWRRQQMYSKESDDEVL